MFGTLYCRSVTRKTRWHSILRDVTDVTDTVSASHPTGNVSKESNRCARQCVAILTGHPRVTGRLEYVIRILRQLREQVAPIGGGAKMASNGAKMAPNEFSGSSSDACKSRPTDVFVYCDGDCGDALRSEFAIDTWVKFLRLPDEKNKHG